MRQLASFVSLSALICFAGIGWVSGAVDAPALEIRPLKTAYEATLASAENLQIERPISLASADLDADGVADLVCGHSGPAGNALSIHRGNLHAIFPHAPQAPGQRHAGTLDASPFLSPASLFEIGARPDFIATGDFDGDGRGDVVLAQAGDETLYLAAGDGGLGLLPLKGRPLGGRITALTSGEINRTDGLIDLVVAIDSGTGPAVLVFEGPDGAWFAEPERLALAEPANALALGRIAGGWTQDLVVASGRELVVFEGRDRRLTSDTQRRADVTAPVVRSLRLEAEALAVSAGDFIPGRGPRSELAVLLDSGVLRILGLDDTLDGKRWNSLAEHSLSLADRVGDFPGAERVVPVRLSGADSEELLVIDPGAYRVHHVSRFTQGRSGAGYAAEVRTLDLANRPSFALPMRLSPAAQQQIVLAQEQGLALGAAAIQATITVNSAADTAIAGDAACTFREAINNANADMDTTAGDCVAGSGADSIAFSIGGGGSSATVAVTSPLPALSDAVTINGNTQGCADPPCIVLNGAATGGASGLALTASGSTLRGMVIQAFGASGVKITSNGNFIEGCYIGTDVDGTVASGNGAAGVEIKDASDNTIGGTAASARNLISANQYGVFLDDGAHENEVAGNFIGTDADGLAPLGNITFGVDIKDGSEDNRIGGTDPGAGNLISGNTGRGVAVRDGGTTGNLIQGNLIGTDATGTAPLGNAAEGVYVYRTPNSGIGGSVPAARNVICANNRGILIEGSASTGNVAQGNYIGVDATGSAAMGNTQYGTRVSASNDNLVGGWASGAGNVISGNDAGVLIGGFSEATDNNNILGNRIGTDASGTVDLGNATSGVAITGLSRNNRIGSSSAGSGNLISANGESGVRLASDARATYIWGNRIGTDITGTVALGNGLHGVSVETFQSTNVIGGSGPGAGNLISANGGHGIWLSSENYFYVIQGNRIGTDATGFGLLGNAMSGVRIDAGGGGDHSIGGTVSGAGNIIAGNGEEGIAIVSFYTVTGMIIQGNSIFANGDLGIDLGDDGVTANDVQDPDPGVNRLQNYPVLDTATANHAMVTIDGTLNSERNRFYRVEFFAGSVCDASGHGEGERYLGHATVNTNANGDAAFSVGITAGVGNGEAIAAIATHTYNGSSEFSNCITAFCPQTWTFEQTITAQDTNTFTWQWSSDVRFVKGNLADVSAYALLGGGSMQSANSLDISLDRPAPGSGLYYLVRRSACGSWQTSSGAEPRRDLELP